jgi:stage V sporulation protein G
MFSNIKVTLYKLDSLRAVVSLRLCDSFHLTGLRIIEGKKGLFVAMPSRKAKDGEYFDIYYPVSNRVKGELNKAVLEAYEKELTKCS